ncbi:segregation and condensation protein A [Streptomyces marincola]|uniref:segregation and condensation protein A n=1 Tax=Streptomyces marincola TaxID=2878388 RepID=UPI001CF4FDA0|nr:segregation/condensation protein A [Streptomyces marincola]UCM87129.1 segregation/condensation protein A [Streptomyces marincola]
MDTPARPRRLLGRGPGARPPAAGEGTKAPAEERDAAAPAGAPAPAGPDPAGTAAPAAPPEQRADSGAPAPGDGEPGDGPAEERGERRGPAPAAPAAAGPEPGDRGGAGAATGPAGENDGRFTVVLANFEGPFDLLLQLISRHKMDVTEVALSRVTDDFMAHIRAMGPDGDLDQTTEFLVIAATLLDLKAARLLPAAEVEDEADLALLEARDLLFARLLQYRAYKRVADIFGERLAAEAARHPRTVGLEPHHAELLPDVVIRIGPEGFARLAVKAMRPRPEPQVYVDHIHAPLVSVREQAEVLVARLRELGRATFAELTRDAGDTLTVVARFLALLELYRERAVALDQDEALGPLLVRWEGEATGRPLVTDEFDRAVAPEGDEPAPRDPAAAGAARGA